MDRKVGLRSGQRPVGYHASPEGLNELQDARDNAKRARRGTRKSFRNRLEATADELEDEPQESLKADSLEEERVTFHPGGPGSRHLKPGERWRIKG